MYNIFFLCVKCKRREKKISKIVIVVVIIIIGRRRGGQVKKKNFFAILFSFLLFASFFKICVFFKTLVISFIYQQHSTRFFGYVVIFCNFSHFFLKCLQKFLLFSLQNHWVRSNFFSFVVSSSEKFNYFCKNSSIFNHFAALFFVFIFWG